MVTIIKPDNKPLKQDGQMVVPARFIPSFRTCRAVENKSQNNILLKLHGGLGDVVCAEPAVRFSIQKYSKDNKISLLTKYPELFRHLQFTGVFDETNHQTVNYDQYLMFQNIDQDNELTNEYFAHPLIHAVDYAALYMWRRTLTREEKIIRLQPTGEDYQKASVLINPLTDVLVHPGRTWKSRTFPKHWWDGCLDIIKQAGKRPVIIGGVVDNNRASTVDVNTEGCLDLRSRISLMESVAVIHLTHVMITNDSAPLHMAASGDNNWIGFVSTVKHQDLLLHWRNGSNVFGYKMQDFSHGGMWQQINDCPNNPVNVHVDDIDIQDLLRFLPTPREITEWSLDKLPKT